MAIRIIPVPLTVYDQQNFISRHFVTPVLPDTGTVTLSSYSITTAANPVGVNFASGVTVSIAGTSLTISGRYENVFNDESWTIRKQQRNTSLTTYTSISDIPEQYYAAVAYAPDMRSDIDVTITVVTDKGTTSLIQRVRNDWSTKRNRLIDVIYAADVDKNTFSRDQLLAGPADIDSDEINTSFFFVTSISTNIINYNLHTAALAAGWSGINPLLATVTVETGVYIYSTSINEPAFTIGADIPTGSDITIINNGFIMGQGGVGYGYGGTTFYPATSGGTALNITCAGVKIQSTSYIGGGGGGGGMGGSGGGGGAGGGAGGRFNAYNGGVLAGGAGGGPGQTGSNGSTDISSSGGGGGRIMPGVGGGQAGKNMGGRGGGAGGGGGGGGCGGTPGGFGGSGGANGEDLVYSAGPGNGGGAGGGGWGARGGTNANSNGTVSPYVPGVGGKAVSLNGFTVEWIGGFPASFILGAVA